MTTCKTGVGRANGKIILLGEHSVVYHQPSIAIPFPAAQIKTTITKTDQPTTLDCQFYRGLIDDMPELLESLKAVISVCLAQLNQPDDTFHIVIDSDIPAERGMGSSAAVAVATTRAIYDYFDTPLSQDHLLDIVEVSEKIAHGNPSGLDALMTSSSTPYFYTKGKPFEPIHLDLDAYLIVGDTGKTGQTKEAVQSIADKLASNDGERYKHYIDELGSLARLGRISLEHNQPKDLGIHMNHVHSYLQKLGVSSDELDHLVTTARQHHALGAKLTGGGRGGCMIALADTKECATSIGKALEHAGAKQTWIYEMSESK